MSAGATLTADPVSARLGHGDLTGALAAANAAIKAAPQRQELRLALADLLILAGDFERADKVLELVAKLKPADAVGVGIQRGFLQGMMARRAWFRDGAVPAFPNGPSAADQAALRLSLALRAGQAEDARAALAGLEEARSAEPYLWNGRRVDEPLRDLDDRLPHAFEAVTSGGAYLWIDFAKVRRVAFAPVSRPRDLALRQAKLELRDGSAAEVLVPAICADADGDEPRDALALGRETDFVGGAGGTLRARGQRCFLVGEESLSVLEAAVIEWPEQDDG